MEKRTRAGETSIHGHEVIEMIIASGRPWGREELAREIDGRWGGQARFHTCSAEGMNRSELVHFLSERGKFLESEIGVTMDPSKVCNH